MRPVEYILTLVCLWLMACEHKELCLDHSTHTERVEYHLALSYDNEGV